jgi:hypothetical protein
MREGGERGYHVWRQSLFFCMALALTLELILFLLFLLDYFILFFIASFGALGIAQQTTPPLFASILVH